MLWFNFIIFQVDVLFSFNFINLILIIYSENHAECVPSELSVCRDGDQLLCITKAITNFEKGQYIHYVCKKFYLTEFHWNCRGDEGKERVMEVTDGGWYEQKEMLVMMCYKSH